jgi:hypothetical protein
MIERGLTLGKKKSILSEANVTIGKNSDRPAALDFQLKTVNSKPKSPPKVSARMERKNSISVLRANQGSTADP